MIVCSCNVISELDIEEAILRLLERDPWMLIVPVKVYHALGERGKCCGCFPGLVDTIVRVTEDFHRARATAEDTLAAFVAKLRRELQRIELVRQQARERMLEARAA